MLFKNPLMAFHGMKSKLHTTAHRPISDPSLHLVLLHKCEALVALVPDLGFQFVKDMLFLISLLLLSLLLKKHLSQAFTSLWPKEPSLERYFPSQLQ